jgi:hypothetical protein
MGDSGRPRAYTFAVVGTGSVSRAVVRFRCVECAHELELANNNSQKHHTYFSAQAKRKGWDTDGIVRNRVFCPECRKTPASRSRRQIELDSVVLPALEPPTIEGVVEPWVEGHSPGVLAVLDDAVADMADGIARLQEAPMARDLTNEQRRSIRLLLDQFFDDKEGCYLADDGGVQMSDQAIGARIGVPWGEVTKIREASYGRIMADPMLVQLRTRMAELEKQMGEMRRALDGYGRRLVQAS